MVEGHWYIKIIRENRDIYRDNNAHTSIFFDAFYAEHLRRGWNIQKLKISL